MVDRTNGKRFTLALRAAGLKEVYAKPHIFTSHGLVRGS